MLRPVFTNLLRPRYFVAMVLIAYAFWQWHALTAMKVSSNQTHVDERGWIASALAYCDLLYTGDFSPADWEQRNLGAFGNLNPHLGKVMLGTPAYFTAKKLRMHYRPQDRLTMRDTDGLCSKGVPRPPLKIYHAARNTAKFWAGLTAATLILSVCWLFGTWAGVIFSFTLLWNRTFRINSAFALTDMPYLFLLNIALIAGVLVLRARSRGALLAVTALLGIGAGLATSVKVTAIVTLSIYTIALLGTLVYLKRAGIRRAAAGFGVYLVAALVVIFALDPFFWPDLSAIDLDAAAEEVTLVRDPASAGVSWNDEDSLWKSMTETELDYSVVRAKAPHLRAMLRPLEYPLLYPRWGRLFEALGQRFPRNSTWEIVRESLTGHTSSMFEVALFALGFYVTAKATVASLRNGVAPAALAILAYVTIQLAFLIYALPVGGMARYVLPFLVVSKVLVALGMLAALEPPRQLLSDLWKARQARVTSTTAL